jgi:hypothetical protein
MKFYFPNISINQFDFKRIAIIVGAGVVILCGHYIDSLI